MQAAKINTVTQPVLSSYMQSNHKLEAHVWDVIRGLKSFTADDLHVLETEIKHHGRDKRVIGAICRSFANQGLIKKLGYESSSRSECHNRPVIRWEVVQ